MQSCDTIINNEPVIPNPPIMCRGIFAKKYPAAAPVLQEWYDELANCELKKINVLKKVYGNTILVADDRMVLSIRLINTDWWYGSFLILRLYR